MIRSISWSPDPARLNESVSISITIGNDGNASAQNLSVRYYLSSDADLSSDDHYLGFDSFGISATDIIETITFVPQDISGLVPGDYYVIIYIPSENESWRRTNDTITLQQVPTGPDMEIGAITWTPDPATMSDNVTINVETRNVGDQAFSSRELRYYLSTDTGFSSSSDFYIGNDTESLAAGASDSETITFVPQDISGLVPGDYYVIIYIPSENESWRRTNDTITLQQVPTGPDMEIGAITWTPDPATMSDNVTINVETRNVGDQAFSSRELRYYLSTDTGFSSSSDFYIGNDTESLAAGASDSETITFVPQDISGLVPGDYYVIIYIPSENESWRRTNDTITLEAVSGTPRISVSPQSLTISQSTGDFHLAPSQSFASDSLFRRVTLSEQTLQLLKAPLSKYRASKTTESIEVVSIEHDALGAGQVVLNVSSSRRFWTTLRATDQHAVGGMSWSGQLSRPPGYVVLVVNNDKITGSIRTETETFSIRPLAGTFHAIIKQTSSNYPVDGKPVLPPGSQNNREEKGSPLDDGAHIDVLVAYTPGAARSVSDIVGLNQLAVAETNQTYSNSAIAPRLRIVHQHETQYTDGSEWDLDRLADGGDGVMDEVHMLRDQYAADIVILMVESAVGRIDGEVRPICGVAYLSVFVQDAENWGFGLVDTECVSNLTFAHEVGHIQGARHNPEEDSGTPFDYGHGYLYQAGGWMTVMAYNSEDRCCSRLPNWSNPRVSYQGAEMGTAATHDNARVLNETALQVANYRDSGLASASFQIQNVGSSSLVVTDVQADRGWLTLTHSSLPLSLPPQATASIGTEVNWGAISATSTASVSIQSNDPNSPSVQVSVVAIPTASPTTFSLQVESSGCSGPTISVSPSDNSGNGSGVAPFARTYTQGGSVVLTAPTTCPGTGSSFREWRSNGSTATNSTSVQVAVNANMALSAVYESGGTSIDVALPSTTGRMGDAAVVAIQTGNLGGHNISAFDFSVAFDPSIVSITGVSGSGLASACQVAGNAPQQGQFAVSAGCSSPLAGSGTLVELQAEYVGEGTTALTFTSFRFNEGNPAANLTNGNVVVTSCPICGDASGNGTVSGFDASLILQHNVGINLGTFWGCAADVTGNGAITGFDASQVLQYNVGLVSELTCSVSKASEVISDVAAGELRMLLTEPRPAARSLRLILSAAKEPIFSTEVNVILPNLGGSLENVIKTNLPEDWRTERHFDGGTLRIIAAGATPASVGELLRIDIAADAGVPEAAEVRFNEGPWETVTEAPSDGPFNGYVLEQNYPNPFNPSTAITFELPEGAWVSLVVFDLLGREVESLADGHWERGRHSVVFDASRVPSGIYIYRMRSSDFEGIRQMVLLK